MIATMFIRQSVNSFESYQLKLAIDRVFIQHLLIKTIVSNEIRKCFFTYKQ